MKSLYLWMILVAFFSGCRSHEDKLADGRVEASQQQREMALRITGVAFAQILEEESKFEWEYREYVSDIQNYDVSVRRIGKDIEVEYVIRQPQVGEINGGGARYVVDGSSGRIINFEGYK